MRLVKRVCKACTLDNGFHWLPGDDRLWRDKMVNCPPTLRGNLYEYPIVSGPPRYCEYAVEHVVAQRRKK